jgi:hypothetical protein
VTLSRGPVRAHLSELEELLERSGVAPVLESLLPTGGRPRQLPARTLLLGMLLAAADDRPAHLTRVLQALHSLAKNDQRRLGVLATRRGQQHLLTYRQLEHTFASLRRGLASEDGAPTEVLCRIVDGLLEASVAERYKDLSPDLAVDWTDLAAFARPGSDDEPSADPDAYWGHRSGGGPGRESEMFFGYYLQLATMVGEVNGPAVPELARRMVLASTRRHAPPLMVESLERLRGSGVGLGDVIADRGYSYADAQTWATPLRRIGASLVHDLHPNDRGMKGTEAGAVIANGCLYCPATPVELLQIEPLGREATGEALAAHDRRTKELAAYKLATVSAPDADGYYRLACPALSGKLRCPLREESMSRPLDRPEILEPPKTPPRCCVQQTVTIPPTVAQKTRQRNDYPGKAWRQSFARRTAAERANATIKDPSRMTIAPGWCRLMGLPGITLLVCCGVAIRNLRVTDAFEARLAEDRRRAALGLAPKTRRRRRAHIGDGTAPRRRRPAPAVTT